MSAVTFRVSALALATALSTGSLPALASPVTFTFTDTVQSIFSGFPAAVGDVVTVTVIADNGGSSLASQSWVQSDVLSAGITIGNTYSGSFAAPYFDFLSNPLFRTDAAGSLDFALFNDIDDNNTDSLGNSVKLFSNGVLSGARSAFFATGMRGAESWTLRSAPNPVSAPPSLALAVLALGLMGTMRRRRVAA